MEGSQIKEIYNVSTSGSDNSWMEGWQSLCDYYFTRSRDAVKKAAVFFGIIAVFIIGAVIGNFCVEYLAEKAIAVSAALLSVSFIMMLINEE